MSTNPSQLGGDRDRLRGDPDLTRRDRMLDRLRDELEHVEPTHEDLRDDLRGVVPREDVFRREAAARAQAQLEYVDNVDPNRDVVRTEQGGYRVADRVYETNRQRAEAAAARQRQDAIEREEQDIAESIVAEDPSVTDTSEVEVDIGTGSISVDESVMDRRFDQQQEDFAARIEGETGVDVDPETDIQTEGDAYVPSDDLVAEIAAAEYSEQLDREVPVEAVEVTGEGPQLDTEQLEGVETVTVPETAPVAGGITPDMRGEDVIRETPEQPSVEVDFSEPVAGQPAGAGLDPGTGVDAETAAATATERGREALAAMEAPEPVDPDLARRARDRIAAAEAGTALGPGLGTGVGQVVAETAAMARGRTPEAVIADAQAVRRIQGQAAAGIEGVAPGDIDVIGGDPQLDPAARDRLLRETFAADLGVATEAIEGVERVERTVSGPEAAGTTDAAAFTTSGFVPELSPEAEAGLIADQREDVDREDIQYDPDADAFVIEGERRIERELPGGGLGPTVAELLARGSQFGPFGPPEDAESPETMRIAAEDVEDAVIGQSDRAFARGEGIAAELRDEGVTGLLVRGAGTGEFASTDRQLDADTPVLEALEGGTAAFRSATGPYFRTAENVGRDLAITGAETVGTGVVRGAQLGEFSAANAPETDAQPARVRTGAYLTDVGADIAGAEFTFDDVLGEELEEPRTVGDLVTGFGPAGTVRRTGQFAVRETAERTPRLATLLDDLVPRADPQNIVAGAGIAGGIGAGILAREREGGETTVPTETVLDRPELPVGKAPVFDRAELPVGDRPDTELPLPDDPTGTRPGDLPVPAEDLGIFGPDVTVPTGEPFDPTAIRTQQLLIGEQQERLEREPTTIEREFIDGDLTDGMFEDVDAIEDFVPFEAPRDPFVERDIDPRVVDPEPVGRLTERTTPELDVNQAAESLFGTDVLAGQTPGVAPLEGAFARRDQALSQELALDADLSDLYGPRPSADVADLLAPATATDLGVAQAALLDTAQTQRATLDADTAMAQPTEPTAPGFGYPGEVAESYGFTDPGTGRPGSPRLPLDGEELSRETVTDTAAAGTAFEHIIADADEVLAELGWDDEDAWWKGS